MTISVEIDAQRPQSLWLLSDLHIGHVNFDRELFERHRTLAKQARARVVFLGDALEAVVTGSKVANLGGQFDQTSDVGQQADEFVDYMKGFRVLATVDGNHERRITRVTGRSPMVEMARQLSHQQRYPCEYLEHGSFVNLKVGKANYSILIHHGEGGPTTFFKQVMADYPGADLYAGGHSHQLSTEEVFVHSPKGKALRISLVRTGSYLHLPKYAADRPSIRGIPATGSYLLWLYPEHKRLRLEQMADREDRAA